eukprot:m51a1_g298 hypothetical protein (494) ;mRNA; r:363433-365612
MRDASTRTYLWIDLASWRRLAAAGALCAAVLLLSVVGGACGPALSSRSAQSAYGCPGGAHTWAPGCTGVRLGQPNATWAYELGPLSSLNGFWGASLAPWALAPNASAQHSRRYAFGVRVSVWARDEVGQPWETVKLDSLLQVDVACPHEALRGKRSCDQVSLMSQGGVDHKYLKMHVSLTDAADVGDVSFEFVWGTQEFANLEIGMNIAFILLSALLAALFLWKLRDVDSWHFDQKLSFCLTVALMIQNNPFASIKYAGLEYAFAALSSLTHCFYLSLLFLLWFIYLDRLRMETKGGDTREVFSGKRILPKVVSVLVFFLFSSILFIWTEAAGRRDPVLGLENARAGLNAVLAIVLMLLIGIGGALAVGVAMALPLRGRSDLYPRYLFHILPMAVVMLSVLVSVCNKSYDPSRRTALEVVYEDFLYFVYTATVLISCWPVRRPNWFSGVVVDKEQQQASADSDSEAEADSESRPVLQQPQQHGDPQVPQGQAN